MKCIACRYVIARCFTLLLSVSPSLSAVLKALFLTQLPSSPHLVTSWNQLHQQVLKAPADLQHDADQKLAAHNAYAVVMQADAHAVGSAVPIEAECLTMLIPDVTEHTSAARLIRRLLHPNPFRRPTVQQAVDDEILQP